MSRKPAASLTQKILIAMVAGLALGVLIDLFLSDVAFVREKVVDGALKVIGAVFVAALKMMVVLLVFVSLVGGVTSMGNARALGRIGSKALGIYVFTTMVAVTIALSLSAALSPGKGMKLETSQTFTPRKRLPWPTSSSAWCRATRCRPWPRATCCRSSSLRSCSASRSRWRATAASTCSTSSTT